MRDRTLIFLLTVLLVAGSPASAKSHELAVPWSSLSAVVLNRNVTITEEGGTSVRGRVVAVDEKELTIDRGAAGRGPIARQQIREIRFVRYEGNGRRWGKYLGGAAGLLAGLVGAVAIGLDESATGKGDHALAAASAVAGLPAGLAIGYFAGRAVDRVEVTVRILP